MAEVLWLHYARLVLVIIRKAGSYFHPVAEIPDAAGGPTFCDQGILSYKWNVEKSQQLDIKYGQLAWGKFRPGDVLTPMVLFPSSDRTTVTTAFQKTYRRLRFQKAYLVYIAPREK